MRIKLLVTAMVTLLFAIPSFADLLLAASLHSGFVPHELSFSIDCRVHNDHVLIIKKQGAEAPKQIYFENNVNLKTLDLIKQASAGDVTSVMAPTDIGNSIYNSYLKVAPGKVLQVDLGSTRDSDSITTNSSPAANELKEMLEVLCHREK